MILKMKFIHFGYLLFVLSILAFCSNRPAIIDKPQGIQEKNVIEQEIRVPPLPDSISFAGEKTPLSFFDVREALQRELTSICFLHGTMTYILRLDNRYGPTIRKVLKEEGLHEDFYFLCVTESMLQPLVSTAQAEGYWQFLSTTAKEFGLTVNSEVDERYHIEKSTRAAAAYLKHAYKECGSWTLAAAAYNTGIKNVKDRVKIQALNNYYDMQFVLETARYVYRILAHKLVMTAPRTYGFVLEEADLFPEFEYDEIEVKGSVDNWSVFAAEHGTNFKLLKMMNEWIRSNKLDNPLKKTYVVKVPKKGFREAL
jgi:hypothetical protein